MTVALIPDTPTWDRFWSKVDTRGDCWVWLGAKSSAGYGNFGVTISPRNTRTLCAHRLAWESLVGCIDARLDLDHLCRNRACVNPDHLEPVTRAVNIRRGAGVPRGRCSNGHDMADLANTHFTTGDKRVCRRCTNDAARRRRLAYKSPVGKDSTSSRHR